MTRRANSLFTVVTPNFLILAASHPLSASPITFPVHVRLDDVSQIHIRDEELVLEVHARLRTAIAPLEPVLDVRSFIRVSVSAHNGVPHELQRDRAPHPVRQILAPTTHSRYQGRRRSLSR